MVRGRPDLVLPADDDGPGAVALVRPEGTDMFGYGAREAVLHALRGDPAARAPFGAPRRSPRWPRRWPRSPGPSPARTTGGLTVAGGHVSADAVRALGFAHGWEVVTGQEDGLLRLQPVHP